MRTSTPVIITATLTRTATFGAPPVQRRGRFVFSGLFRGALVTLADYLGGAGGSPGSADGAGSGSDTRGGKYVFTLHLR